MSVTLENDVTLSQMQDRKVEADDVKEALEDAISSARGIRGMVNGLAAGLIIWAVIIYLLMK